MYDSNSEGVTLVHKVIHKAYKTFSSAPGIFHSSGCSVYSSLSTMFAKSLGTLPVIYAADEQQNPLPRKTMLFEGDTNSTGGRNDVFPSS